MTTGERSPCPDRLPLAGYPVAAVRSESLQAALIADLEAGRSRKLFFVNTNFVNQCGHLRIRMCEPDVILVNDGVGMDIASYLVHRRRYPDNLNGTDFVPALLEAVTDHFQRDN